MYIKKERKIKYHYHCYYNNYNNTVIITIIIIEKCILLYIYAYMEIYITFCFNRI